MVAVMDSFPAAVTAVVAVMVTRQGREVIGDRMKGMGVGCGGRESGPNEYLFHKPISRKTQAQAQ